MRVFKRLMIVFIVTTLLFGSSLAVLIYSNYDYLMFKILMAENYIFTDGLDEIYKEQIDSDGEIKSYYKNFDDVVIGVFTDKIRETNGDKYTYLYTPPQFQQSLKTTEEVAKTAEIIEMMGSWVYINIPNISTFTSDFIEKNKEILKNYKNIIIDLRSNHGGELDALYKMCELFLDKGMIIGSEKARSNFFSKIVKAKTDRYFDFENIVCLENAETASAAEGFIMALKENLGNVTIVGEKSFGKGIGQVTIPLKGGFAVKATVITIETPNGGSIHEKGIEPDIEYKEKDGIVEFVLKSIEKE